MPNNNAEDFTDIIAKAQQVSKDMGSLFGGNAPGRVAFEPGRAGPAHDFDAHINVFLMPGDQDGYQDVLNKILRGEALLRYEDRTFTKEGDFMVAICYLTPRAQPAAPPDRDAGDAEPVVRPRRLP